LEEGKFSLYRGEEEEKTKRKTDCVFDIASGGRKKITPEKKAGGRSSTASAREEKEKKEEKRGERSCRARGKEGKSGKKKGMGGTAFLDL